ncbi:LytR cell envelope-related transcriptional attenuator [Duganella sp. CF517]|uniref:LytR C-terminal domain-containing protein n=1 Tax=Duganella sp. CF517 TaxID=1881038 RepID=UPI0008CC691F|nr:LytR C-terminal domain-containing protein [Duganella sp. CF517]SEO61001.1 LytR cell envelope-related transcriptional attenuator [Duganella sp. CF517]
MKKTLLATAAGLALIACGGMQKQAPSIEPPAAVAPGGQVVTALERACLSDPMDAARWEALAAALESDGQRERARTMYGQAATLRAHDVRRDYALLQEKAAAPRDAAPEPSASMPRTEVRRLGGALVEVLRIVPVAATAMAMPAPMPARMPMPGAPASPAAALPVRLEISNGNGINGAAARLARSLSVEGLKTVRLTNVKNFGVPVSRIEYQMEQQAMAESLSERLGLPLTAKNEKSSRADMRIVLGHDAAVGGRFK